MSTQQKVSLVSEVRSCFGLGPPLRLLALPRSTWYYQQAYRRSDEEKYRHLRTPLETIARAHSEYGYRRTTTELHEAYGQVVNHKVVQRLHRLWDLPLLRGTKPPRPSKIRRVISTAGNRADLVHRLEQIGPFEVAYTDFTELVYARGKAHLIAIVDHTTKVTLGWAVSARAVTAAALRAWQRAKVMLERLGRSGTRIIIHHDQDPVFTGYRWTTQLLLKDRARLSYALNGAKDNAEMESFFSRFKNENRSLFLDAGNLEALVAVVARRMEYYNRERRHSTLGNQAPLTYVENLRTQL